MKQMSTKHTPGPWIVARDPEADCDHRKPLTVREEYIEDSPHKYRVAEVYAWGSMVERDANAKLIAASPVMYDALEIVLSWLTNVNTHEPIQVAGAVIEALRLAGADESNLDGAALAMLSGAAHR
jgi:hypothetical protein